MKKKKVIIIAIVLLFILMLIPLPMKLKDGGSIEYKAILYKVTKVHRINEQSSTGYETGWEVQILGLQVYNKVNVEVVAGSKLTINEIYNKLNNYFAKNNPNNENVALMYIDESKNKIVLGLVENTKQEQNDLLDKVFSKCCGNDTIDYIKKNNVILFESSKYTIDTKIIKAEDDRILVEVSKDTDRFKKGNKVSMKIKRPTSGTNDFYITGNNVRITFNGNIETSNPPQIGIIDIELIN